MELLKIMRNGISRIPEGYKNSGLDAVVLHIERAERYWQIAKKDSDEAMFTDVIYRTNQAFEGALKEAYLMLAGKDPSNKKPFEIEQYLETSNILKDRVLASLTNYRQEWRNQSTHNYQLFFTEQEALLAITSVSTFSIILLEQIITKANENYERDRAQEFSEQVIGSISDYQNLRFEMKVFALLAKSYEFIQLSSKIGIKEYEYLGLLSGYIDAVDPSIVVQSDVKISTDSGARADLILSSGNEKVLVEIKRKRSLHNYRNQAMEQLLNYLNISKIEHGVLMIFDEKAKKGTWYTQETLFSDGPKVTYINPADRDD